MIRIFICLLAAIILCLGLSAIYTFWQAREIEARFPPVGVKLDVDGTAIHLTDLQPNISGHAAGKNASREKAAVVLIHGASGNEAEMRLALAPALLKLNYRVLSVDRPGLGWSDRPSNRADNTPAGQARLIRAALEKHGIKQATIVVHSLAGAVGLQLALDHADFAQGLLMISPATHPWPGGIALYYTMSASQLGQIFNYTLALPLGQAFMQPAVKSVFAPQAPPSGHLANVKLPLVLRPKTFAANAHDVAGLYDFVTAQSPRYKNIRIPVAIISGGADTIVLTNIHSRNSAREIPGATLSILPGVGHAPHWSHSAEVIAEVEKLQARMTPVLPATAGQGQKQSAR